MSCFQIGNNSPGVGDALDHILLWRMGRTGAPPLEIIRLRLVVQISGAMVPGVWRRIHNRLERLKISSHGVGDGL